MPGRKKPAAPAAGTAPSRPAPRSPQEIDLPDGRRVCVTCSETKPLEDYHWRSKAKGMRHFSCKPCRRAAEIARRAANPEKKKAVDAAYARTERGKAVRRAAVLKYEARYRDRARARWRFQNATRAGHIVRPQVCEAAGCDRQAVDAHHPDYSRPFEVTHLCRRCHVDVHQRGALILKDGKLSIAPPRPGETRPAQRDVT